MLSTLSKRARNCTLWSPTEPIAPFKWDCYVSVYSRICPSCFYRRQLTPENIDIFQTCTRWWPLMFIYTRILRCVVESTFRYLIWNLHSMTTSYDVFILSYVCVTNTFYWVHCVCWLMSILERRSKNWIKYSERTRENLSRWGDCAL